MRTLSIALLMLTTGCGARSGLLVTVHDAGVVDATSRVDAGPPADAGPPDEPERDAMLPQTRHTLAAGGDFTCALDATGQVLCWGVSAPRDWDPDAGLPRRCDAWGCSRTPQVVAGVSGAVDVSAGSNGEVCARTTSGQVLCWGGNIYGELGNGSVSMVAAPQPVVGLTDAAQVSVDRTSCALRTSGGVACWGRNDYGVVGNGSTTDSSVPVAVLGLSDATDLAVGYDDACAVHATGIVSCWGQADYGGLGDGVASHARCHGDDDCALSPSTMVAGLDDVIDVAVGGNFACARRRTGAIACWGDDHYGELGSGTPLTPCSASTRTLGPQPCAIAPLEVAGITDAVQIDAGRLNGCALRRTGHVVCWGDDGAGQLGDGDVIRPYCAADACSYAPVAVLDITDATEVAVGSFHVCARLASHSIVCWGDNEFGELGDGGLLSRTRPTPVLLP